MERVLPRIPAALTTSAALLLLGATGASAQVPTVTPTPTPTVTPAPTPTVTPTPTPVPPSERTKAVKKVYKDYRHDGVIEACDHSKKTLKKTLKELDPQADIDTPDLRPALEAAIAQHHKTGCDRNGDGKVDSQDVKPGSTGSTGSGTGSTGTPAPTPAPTAVPTPAPTTPPSAATVAPLPAPKPSKTAKPDKGDVVPLTPAPTPAPPAATPPPAEPSGPVATPSVVYRNADDPVPVSLLVLAALLALLAVLALVYVAVTRLGWAEKWLAGPRRAWREAAFRMGGTWGDFADWMRVGR